ncbi:MAG: hypothetical protein AAF471_05620, partial [Myxococcota bacterium]
MRLVIAVAVSLLLFGCPFNLGSNEGLGSTLAQTPPAPDVTRQLAGGTTPQVPGEDRDSCAGGDCRPEDTTYHGTQTCELLGYRGGQLRCKDCEVDRSDCAAQGFCGDAIVQGSDEVCEVGQTIPCKDLPVSLQPADAPYRQGTARCNPLTCMWDRSVCRPCTGDSNAGEQCSLGQTQDCHTVDAKYQSGPTASCDTLTCQWMTHACHVCGAGAGDQCAVGQTQDCTLFTGENFKQGSTATCDATTCQWVKSGCSRCTASGGEECAVGQTQSCTA